MSNVQIINLTPHEVNLITEGGVTLNYPSQGVARCAQDDVQWGELSQKGGSVPLFHTTFGDVTGLPDQEEGFFYIVSALVRAAVPNRSDVISPTRLVRNELGAIIGCGGFTSNNCNGGV